MSVELVFFVSIVWPIVVGFFVMKKRNQVQPAPSPPPLSQEVAYETLPQKPSSMFDDDEIEPANGGTLISADAMTQKNRDKNFTIFANKIESGGAENPALIVNRATANVHFVKDVFVSKRSMKSVIDSLDRCVSALDEIKRIASSASETAKAAESAAREAKTSAEQAKDAVGAAMQVVSAAKAIAEAAKSAANTASSEAAKAKEGAGKVYQDWYASPLT